MSEENRQQQSSAESTVAGAAKTGKAIASKGRRNWWRSRGGR